MQPAIFVGSMVALPVHFSFVISLIHDYLVVCTFFLSLHLVLTFFFCFFNMLLIDEGVTWFSVGTDNI